MIPTPQTTETVQSWGRLAAPSHTVTRPRFLDEAQAVLTDANGPILAFGAGRSYGDVCLNSGGDLLRTDLLDRFIAADWETGIVRAEAGMSLDTLLRVAVPKGWFLPVAPGTKFGTLGGAVANDVHGKNHETAGTFGCHVRRLGLARSSGEVLELAPDQNRDIFAATIGGLGLTGLILWAEIALKPITSAMMEVETIEFGKLDTFFELAYLNEGWEYTVAWVDCLATGDDLGRGLFMRARHKDEGQLTPHKETGFAMPIDAPSWLLNGTTVRLFNRAYRARPWASGRRTMHYDSFFFPLDSIGAWNRLYGRRGFFQHQCVVPMARARDAIGRLLNLAAEFRQGSFLIVLKLFGGRASPGLLSFPQAGATLALDLPNKGETTRRLLDAMIEVVVGAGGRLYPAKDATMSPAAFRAGYPNWRKLEELRDPKINSDFWHRVAG